MANNQPHSMTRISQENENISTVLSHMILPQDDKKSELFIDGHKRGSLEETCDINLYTNASDLLLEKKDYEVYIKNDGKDSNIKSLITNQHIPLTLPALKLMTPPEGGWEVPENFSIIVGQIYRSSFPRPENFDYLKQLKLRSILVLIPEEYPEENLIFMRENDIQFFQIGMSGNKEPFVHVPHDVITRALEIAINPANHPLLIHCNRGKHRTGCLSGCIRRLQDWSLTMIFDEYRRFAYPKARALDQQFIELYDNTNVVARGWSNGWLPLKW